MLCHISPASRHDAVSSVETAVQVCIRWWCVTALLLVQATRYTTQHDARQRRDDYQKPHQLRQLPYNCPPCKSCINTEQHCQAGVPYIMDGCNCCYMCARQQGDLCSDKDKCDDSKNLYCDKDISWGVCRASSAKSCSVAGTSYKDGEHFRLNCSQACCSQQCSCQNGVVSCTSLCPHEDHFPSRLHCPNAVLVETGGRGSCCREWVCPHAPREGLDDQPAQKVGRPLQGQGQSRPSVGCRLETSEWSACSVTCGMGVSTRTSTDNPDCRLTTEHQLCLVRPCHAPDQPTHVRGRKCKLTWKPDKPEHLVDKDCVSVRTFRPKYCSTCRRRRCCSPAHTESRDVEFRCDERKIVTQKFMWIQSCSCSDKCDP